MNSNIETDSIISSLSIGSLIITDNVIEIVFPLVKRLEKLSEENPTDVVFIDNSSSGSSDNYSEIKIDYSELEIDSNSDSLISDNSHYCGVYNYYLYYGQKIK